MLKRCTTHLNRISLASNSVGNLDRAPGTLTPDLSAHIHGPVQNPEEHIVTKINQEYMHLLIRTSHALVEIKEIPFPLCILHLTK